LINFSITSRCCCSSSPHMETLTKQFLLGQWNSQSKIYKTPLSLFTINTWPKICQVNKYFRQLVLHNLIWSHLTHK
jgi:hypothetical protein